MRIALSAVQVVVACTMLYVWLFQFNKSTPYRGGDACTMPEEFAAYGLPAWSTYAVGLLKVGAGICLLVGLWIHSLILPAAVVIGVLMVGALAMHLKVHDSMKKFVPAFVLLALCAGMCFGSFTR